MVILTTHTWWELRCYTIRGYYHAYYYYLHNMWYVVVGMMICWEKWRRRVDLSFFWGGRNIYVTMSLSGLSRVDCFWSGLIKKVARSVENFRECECLLICAYFSRSLFCVRAPLFFSSRELRQLTWHTLSSCSLSVPIDFTTAFLVPLRLGLFLYPHIKTCTYQLASTSSRV